MKLLIEIEMGNDAFESASELPRVVRAIADTIEGVHVLMRNGELVSGRDIDGLTFLDINGNACANVEVQP